MKTFLVVISFLLPFKAEAQTTVYHPFPDSNAIWTVWFWDCCWASCPSPPSPNPVVADYNFSYYLQGDTMINAQSYHQIYRSAGTRYEHCAFGGMGNWTVLNTAYMGCYRQDTAAKKIYFIHESASQESVLYDFSLNVGDTLSLSFVCGTCIVSSIDSIMIGNNYRKQYHFFNSWPNAVIEGIGNTAGLLEPIQPFENGGALVCFSQNGQTLYPDTTSQCNILIAGLSDNDEPPLLNIAPNPFHNETTLQVNAGFIQADLYIYDFKGTLLRKQTIQQERTIINRNNLSSGLYLCKLVSRDGLTAVTRLIIE